MRYKPRSKRVVFAILQAEIPARLFDELRDSRIVDVTYPWEEVMLDLKIQPAKQPTLHPAAPREIHGGFYLMNCPRTFHRLIKWQRKLGFLNAMSKLKHNANKHTRNTHGDGIEEKDNPRTMKQKW